MEKSKHENKTDIFSPIVVQNLVKTFGTFKAVDGINFTIRFQEIVGMLGPNGAGKTTTIRLITGVFPLPQASSVKIFGHDIEKENLMCKAQFGIVPEITNAFLDYTVRQNLLFSGKLYGLKKKDIESRSTELIHRFNLDDKMDALVKTLSKGLKQRLNFCQALLHDPPILILDEPTSGLDPISVKILREQILQLKNAGKTILLTTHDMNEAQKICDRILIINHGKIVVDESPDSLRSRFSKTKRILFRPAKELPEDAKATLKSRLTRNQSISMQSNGYFQLSSESPALDISRIYDIFQELDAKIEDIKIEEVSLEEIFIQIIQKEAVLP